MIIEICRATICVWTNKTEHAGGMLGVVVLGLKSVLFAKPRKSDSYAPTRDERKQKLRSEKRVEEHR